MKNKYILILFFLYILYIFLGCYFIFYLPRIEKYNEGSYVIGGDVNELINKGNHIASGVFDVVKKLKLFISYSIFGKVLFVFISFVIRIEKRLFYTLVLVLVSIIIDLIAFFITKSIIWG